MNEEEKGGTGEVDSGGGGPADSHVGGDQSGIPTRRELSTCREPSCRARILWAITQTGRRIPLDFGVHVYQYDAKTGCARRVDGFFVSHFQTCRNPGAFSKGKKC